MQFPMPDELSVAVKELGRQVADWKSLFDNQLRETEEAIELAKHLQGQYSSEMHRQSKAILEMTELTGAITKKLGTTLEQSRSENRVLTARIEELQRNRSNSNAERFGTRERESLLKLVIGMAIGGYGYDPMASRSKIVSDIRGDLDRVGLSLDDDTVRKYLAAGKELLPRDETE
jgi:hypothetical protein